MQKRLLISADSTTADGLIRYIRSRSMPLDIVSFAIQDGALCAVTVDLTEHGRVAARMAVRILNGEKPRRISIVENREGFVILRINPAERRGRYVPYEILQSADKIIG